MNRHWICAAGLVGLVACGSTTTASVDDAGPSAEAGPSNDGGQSGETGTSSDAGDAGACIDSPTVGTACPPGFKSCDRVDPCCAQEIVCDPATQKWKESGVACFQCEGFKCGDKTCPGGGLCLARAGGIPGPDGGVSVSYECVQMPAACSRSWTCGCLTKNPPAGCTLAPSNGCAADGVHVTLSCMGA